MGLVEEGGRCIGNTLISFPLMYTYLYLCTAMVTEYMHLLQFSISIRHPLVPPPTTPTPRPIPEMEESDKALAEGVTRTACFVLIGCLAVTLLIFAIFRIMNHGRFIHMNIEFSLLCAHLCLLPNFVGDEVIFIILYAF